MWVGRASIDDEVRERLKTIAGSRMTADGVLVIDSRAFRTQAQNREAARETARGDGAAGRGQAEAAA